MSPNTKTNTKTAPNGLTNGHDVKKSPLDLHDCHAHPIYPSRVTSDGAAGEDDYPLTGSPKQLRGLPCLDHETARHHNAPVFQGGLPLSKAALANEGENLRHQVPGKYRRISRPVPMMRHEYDVVVIGSGYGGAVAASRIARAGKTVCVLELGKERWPGEFPSDFASAAPEIHITGNIAHTDVSHFDGGDRQGLYHLVLGEGQNVFVGNGMFSIHNNF
jgi:FAD binding domain